MSDIALLTPDEPGTDLKVSLRDDIAERAIGFHYALLAVNTCKPGHEGNLEDELIEAEHQLRCAVERLDLLARHTAKLKDEG